MSQRRMACPAHLLLLLTLMTLATLLQVRGGAIFQTKPIPVKSADDYKVVWNNTLSLPGLPGQLNGAVTPLNGTMLPQVLARLQRCAVANVHLHPWGSEQMFVVSGSIEVGLFTEDLVLRIVRANASEGVLVPQATIHYIRNTANDTTTILSTFDQQGFATILVPNAMVAMPADVRSGFFDGSPPGGVNSPIFTLPNCTIS